MMYFISDDVTSPSCAPGPGPVPYPTLYNASGQEPLRPKSIIEVLIYNIGRLAASVAAGYDVGLSNVMPYNPNMVSEVRRTDAEDTGERTRVPWYEPPGGPGRGAGPALYPHKTYHGHTPHHRTPLPGLAVTSGAEAKPPRFSDSPPPPVDPGNIPQPPPPVATGPGLDRPLYVPPPDYNEPGPGPGYTMARTARYYHDQLEGEREAAGAGYSLYQDRHSYKESPGRGRVPEPHPLAYSNPNYEPQQPRTPGRVTFGHRRTPSGSSSTGYRDGYDQGPGSGPSSSEYSERHERPPPLVPRRLSRQGSYSNEVERPQTLELTRNPLRSSLKKHNYAYSGAQPGGPGQGQGRSANWSQGWGSGGGTPTNENSSSDEVAALCYPPSKSDSGFVSSGRLTGARFSPRAGEKVTDWSPTGTGDTGGMGGMGGSARDIGGRDHYDRRQRPGGPGGSFSADSPGRRSHHPYADFIADNDLKKTGGYDY